MPDEIVDVTTPVSNPFDDNSWVDNTATVEVTEPISTIQQIDDNTGSATIEATEQTASTDTTLPNVDYNSFVKENFGFDSVEVAKEQINKWKEFKEPEFTNEENKRLFDAIQKGKKTEVLQILAKQQAIENLVSADIDERTAPQIVKLAMREKYPTLSEQQIEYKFNKQFAVAPKPEQYSDELDSEYSIRLRNWESHAEDVKQELMIEAHISKPELEKLKSEISLPDIFGSREDVQQLTPQELANIENVKKSHINQISTAINSFNKLDFEVVNGEVKLPISYALANDEKAQMQSILADAIENNDVNKFIGSRWFDEAGNPKTNQAIEDITWMLYGKKIAQKLANESAAQRYEQEVKNKMNLTITPNSQQTFNPNPNEHLKRQMDAIWDA